MESLAVLIVAAGSSLRMDGRDKVWEVLGTKPLLLHSVLTFAPAATKTVVVVKPADRIRVGQLLKSELPEQEWDVIAGGERRQDSVRNGLSACAGVDSIAVHDAARPFATIALLQRVWEESRSTGAAIPAVPVADTIKRVSASLILETVDRASLWAAQTPQVFAAPILRRAYDEAARSDETVTDDAHLVQRLGVHVRVVPGDSGNFKVTTPQDLQHARSLMQSYVTGREERSEEGHGAASSAR